MAPSRTLERAPDNSGRAALLPGDVLVQKQRQRLQQRVGRHSKEGTSVLSATIMAAQVSLKPTLGLFNAVSVIVGVIVGSGIFISPKGVLLEVGSIGSSLLVWSASGVLALIGGLCYIELGVLMPVAGGDYHYIESQYGPFLGFLYAWTQLFLILPSGNAVVSLTFAKYLLQPIFPSCEAPETLEMLVAGVAIVAVTAVNVVSVKWAARMNDFCSVAKVAALLIIVGSGIYTLTTPRSNFPVDAADAFSDSTISATSMSLAFYQGLYSYAGFNFLNFLMGELKNPERNLPLAMLIAMPLITMIYVTTNVAYFSVLNVYSFLESDATALTFADKLVGNMSWIMSLFVSLSCFGALSGLILSSSRLFFAAANKGHLPDFLSLIHVTHSTPLPAILFECGLSLIFLLVKDVYKLINYLTFAEFLFIGIAVSILPYLRWKKPNLPRPIKIPLPLVVIYLISCAFLIITPIIEDPYSNGWGVVIILIGVPVYWFAVLWRPEDKPKPVQDTIKNITHVIQKALLCMKEDEHCD